MSRATSSLRLAVDRLQTRRRQFHTKQYSYRWRNLTHVDNPEVPVICYACPQHHERGPEFGVLFLAPDWLN